MNRLGAVLLFASAYLAVSSFAFADDRAERLADLTVRKNVDPGVVERFSNGATDVQALVTLKAYETNPPFYRPVIDDTPAQRIRAKQRVLAHLGALATPGVVAAPLSGATFEATISLEIAQQLAANGHVHSIALANQPFEQAASLPEVLQTINVVPELSSQGLTGGGRKVAVIDIDFFPAVIQSVLVEEQCFCRAACCANGQTRQSGSGASNIPLFSNYHGTEIAAEIAFSSGQGVAPSASIVAIAAGSALDFLDATSWLADRPDISVVNFSITTGFGTGTCDADPNAGEWLSRIDALDEIGTVFLAATGNASFRTQTGIPSCLSQVTGVGGTWVCNASDYKTPPPGCDAGAVYDTLWPDSNTSLSIDILAPAAPLQLPYMTPGGPSWIEGTSNSTPIAAGCAAILRQWAPNASAEAIRQALKTSPTSVSVPNPPGQSYTRGRLDCNAAKLALSVPAVNLNQFGLSGLWYNPQKPGQGFSFEVFEDYYGFGEGRITGGWFAFAPGQGGGTSTQRWFYLDGDVSGTESTGNFTIYRSLGGVFDQPPVVTPVAIGSGTVSFSSCTEGFLTYAFQPGVSEVGGLSGNIPLTRLLSNVACTPGGNGGEDFLRTGNWYEAATSGQGFILEVNPDSGYLMALWYTYRPAGGGSPSSQRWFSIQDPYTVGQTTVSNIRIWETTGGSLTLPNPPGQPATVAVGTASLTFSGCSSVVLNYTFTSGELAGTSGQIPAVRVGPEPEGC